MIAHLTNALGANPLLTLFLVIGGGYLFGRINFLGFRFGVAGVLFVGLAVGSLGPSISVPEAIPTLGLIIFIYTIGIQSGPAFFCFAAKKWLPRQSARACRLPAGSHSVVARSLPHPPQPGARRRPVKSAP